MTETSRKAIVTSAEVLVAHAVRLLWPMCGEAVTLKMLQKIVEEQTRYASLLRSGEPPSPSVH